MFTQGLRRFTQLTQVYAEGNLLMQALGLGQEDRRGTLRSWGLEAWARGREAGQDRAVCP